jgi:hypothetical protein
MMNVTKVLCVVASSSVFAATVVVDRRVRLFGGDVVAGDSKKCVSPGEASSPRSVITNRFEPKKLLEKFLLCGGDLETDKHKDALEDAPVCANEAKHEPLAKSSVSGLRGRKMMDLGAKEEEDEEQEGEEGEEEGEGEEQEGENSAKVHSRIVFELLSHAEQKKINENSQNECSGSKKNWLMLKRGDVLHPVPRHPTMAPQEFVDMLNKVDAKSAVQIKSTHQSLPGISHQNFTPVEFEVLSPPEQESRNTGSQGESRTQKMFFIKRGDVLYPLAYREGMSDPNFGVRLNNFLKSRLHERDIPVLAIQYAVMEILEPSEPFHGHNVHDTEDSSSSSSDSVSTVSSPRSRDE